ncbi:MAG: thiol:disulfide interchange protein DsbA/DsbL [Azoarcus sp.]|jgi:thiol:disulfide interchange protein DsbA|nr:thiol:disulfide interchange protein DsbA/DsbL [Azoarcus sp.]
MNRRDALQQLGAIALLACPAGFALGQAQGGFQALKPEVSPMSPDAEGKIEVLEFFHYGCSHCRHFEPLVEQWAGRLPRDVAFAQVPVVWREELNGLAHLYYTLQVKKRADLHKAAFAAVQDQRLRFDTPGAVRNWAQANGLDVLDFMGVYDSIGVVTQVKRAQQTGLRYKIDSVPTMAVGGRFLTSATLAGSHEAALKVADSLIERVRVRKE